MNPRRHALKVVQQVLADGKSLNALSATINQTISEPDNRALCRELIYGVIRWNQRLDFYVSHLLDKPLRGKDMDIYCLLLLGAYQICFMRIPDHAAVNETVKLTIKLKKAWAKKLVNGVLRNLIRRKEELENKAQSEEEALYSHPQWFIDAVKADWPEDWQAILNANNQQGPMTLRVNASRTTRETLMNAFASRNITSHVAQFSPQGVVLQNAQDPRTMPEFEQGLFSVQDEAAQLAVDLIEPQPNMQVLDACSAPGGKTAAILEQDPNLRMLALDIDEKRIQSVQQTLQRLSLNAEVQAINALDVEHWWDGNPFDRILLDAPCSGTGVIRRNPDIKVHRQLADIDRLVDNQQQLLKQLWSTLRLGGVLLYATCSILKRENEQQAAAFLRNQPDAEQIPIDAQWGREVSYGRQILPGENGMDGFYYVRFRKLDKVQ